MRNMVKRYTGLRTGEVRENGGLRCVMHAFKKVMDVFFKRHLGSVRMTGVRGLSVATRLFRCGADERFAELMPDLMDGVTPARLHRAFLKATTPKPAPRIDLFHVAPVRVSVADALAELVDELPRVGRISFRRLTSGLVERLADGAPDDAAQHVAATFVTGDDAVGDQEGAGADVVGQHLGVAHLGLEQLHLGLQAGMDGIDVLGFYLGLDHQLVVLRHDVEDRLAGFDHGARSEDLHADNPTTLRRPHVHAAEHILERGKTTVVVGPFHQHLLQLAAFVHLHHDVRAADELAAHGLSTTIADARFMKPLDLDMILKLAREHEVLITIEEGSIGGFGTHVLQTLADHGVLDRGLKIRTMVLPDTFIDHDTPAKMYEQAGLDAKGIVAKVFEALGKDAPEKVQLA